PRATRRGILRLGGNAAPRARLSGGREARGRTLQRFGRDGRRRGLDSARRNHQTSRPHLKSF
ncbi:hypothetical protein TGFOU_407570, partial [Toxoplasma gondii FOU]